MYWHFLAVLASIYIYVHVPNKVGPTYNPLVLTHLKEYLLFVVSLTAFIGLLCRLETRFPKTTSLITKFMFHYVTLCVLMYFGGKSESLFRVMILPDLYSYTFCGLTCTLVISSQYVNQPIIVATQKEDKSSSVSKGVTNTKSVEN